MYGLKPPTLLTERRTVNGCVTSIEKGDHTAPGFGLPVFDDTMAARALGDADALPTRAHVETSVANAGSCDAEPSHEDAETDCGSDAPPRHALAPPAQALQEPSAPLQKTEPSAEDA